MNLPREVFLVKLKQLQDKYGVTNSELADKLGITPQAISNWRSRSDQPTVSQGTIYNVCEVFGVDPSYFEESEATE